MSAEIPGSEFESNSPSSGRDAEEYLRILLANIWLILGITGLFTIAGIFVYSSKPNQYTSTVSILVEKVEGSGRSAQDLMMVMPSFKGEEDYYGTQIAILTGRKISQRVREELKPNVGFSLSARRLPKTRIILLSVTSVDAEWAAKIANKYAEVFVNQSDDEQSFIGKQMLKLIPEEVEENAMALVQETGSMDDLAGFNKEEFADSLSAVANDQTIQRLRSEKLELQTKLVELSQRYKPNHPNTKVVAERLQYVEAELKDRTKRILTNVRINLEGKNRIRNVKVLEEAVPPGRPSAPNRPRGVMSFTFMGLACSLGLVLVLEQTNQKVRNERDFYNVPLPFLGHIPLIKNISKKKKKQVELKEDKIHLPTVLANDAVLADAVASVRTHILFSMPYEKSKRIMLTSCIPDEGKTTVSLLLSLSLCSLGRRIFYIDADMRRPFAHNYLGLRNAEGLSDYLTGSAQIEDIVRSVPDCTLKVVTAGSKSPNPSELLASDRFQQLLEYGSANFDRVVIDVPPVLFIPDGLIVAKHIHTGVLICGSGMVHKKTVQTVKQKFDSIGLSFIGIVVNKVDLEKGVHRYKYYRNYKNYYSHAKVPAPNAG